MAISNWPNQTQESGNLCRQGRKGRAREPSDWIIGGYSLVVVEPLVVQRIPFLQLLPLLGRVPACPNKVCVQTRFGCIVCTLPEGQASVGIGSILSSGYHEGFHA